MLRNALAMLSQGLPPCHFCNLRFMNHLCSRKYLSILQITSKSLCCSTLRNDRYYDRLTDISSRCYEWSSFTNQWFLRKKPLVSPSETDGSPMRTFHHAAHSFCHAARTVICQSIIVSVSLHLSYLQRFMFKIDRLTVFSRNQFF